MLSFKAFLRETADDTAQSDAPLPWWHVHEDATFKLRRISPVVTADSTIPQAKGQRGLFVSQQPWLWENYDGHREYCTEIKMPDTFREGVDYYDGQAERFVMNTSKLEMGETRRIADIQGQ